MASGQGRTTTRTVWLLAATAMMLLPACSSGAPGAPQEKTGQAQSAVITNGGFETGTAGQPPPSWTVNHYLNPGITVQSPQTIAGLNWAPGGVANTVIMHSDTGPGTQTDLALGAAASLRWPRYGKQAAIVNGPNTSALFTTGANRNVNELTQTMTIGAGDIDPADGQVHIRFTVAPVLQDPTHTATQQPYYMVQVTNLTKGNAILYSDFNLSGAGIPWKALTVGGTIIDYTDWQLIDVAPGPTGVSMGDQVKLQIIAAGCQPSAHWGEIYVDGIGPTIPGLSVQGTGPAQANAGSNIAYTFTYKNGSASTACTTSANCSPNTEACVGGFCAETGVTIDFTTPPNTTFQSITPPAGATCTTLPVGGTGTITCTFTNPVGPGAMGTFQVTVNIDGAATGQITCAAYDIRSTQETTLNGTKILTNVGCATDADCPTGDWCNESGNACTPKLANGTAIPTDPAHTNPTLNGTCTAAAGTLVCTSAVCDTADNKCGYLNGDGTCTAATGTTVCRSAVCDPDGMCGYAVGDGPCTAANGATVCRSGACSVNGLCEPAGGCNVDADCTASSWCNESTHTCTPKLANGTAIPSDPPHTNPTLNGTCTAAAGTLVCVAAVCDTTDNKCGYLNGDGPCTAVNATTVCRSAVCDPDSKCGYAVGDGPCTAANATTVCRSGVCSVNGTCEPAGGCNVDADCSVGNWCDESTHTCTAKLINGSAIPSDPPHTNPTLDGTCTTAASTLVCVSAVCDTTDDRCGYADGDGPCTAADGATVCRSAACSANGLCMPAGGCNVDADCSAGSWCNETTHACTAKIANGGALPSDPPHTNPTLDGVCTAPAAILVCASGVCDTADNKCGYVDGDGPCSAANGSQVCRSAACSANGLCMPAGGCNVDADCTAGNWCNETAHACTAKLANGTAMPMDPPHTNPALDGTCATAAATLVCISATCDMTDNACGYLNGNGPCTEASGATVCRSGVCDADLKCGYADGDGPCTSANGTVVCRSGACSANGLCEPAGGCNVDADCTAGNWCNETAHTCTPRLSNGTAMPTDAPHANPTLDGTCTAAAGALVCASGVCDTTDSKCGYTVGSGPCTAADEGTVCRSGACSTNGLCEPTGGCNVDADCTAGNWCNESAHACTPQLPNGSAIPTDSAHDNPTLDGSCTSAAGALVCASAVCDAADNKCGYANGDGPCTAADGSAVCRSTACATTGPNAGLCEPCINDSTCASPTPACDTNKNVCVTCVPGDAFLCTATTPVCDATSETCVACNGDLGSSATDACADSAAPTCRASGECAKCTTNTDCTTGTHAGPICNTTTGVCGTNCTLDSDCASTQWCNDLTPPGVCSPKVDNGKPVPGGTCTPTLGGRACVSGVCDTNDNLCGYKNGDGPCTDSNGSVVCRSQTCATSGPNAGLCEQCTDNTACSGNKPICDAATNECVACGGDQGTNASNACPSASQPFCAANGACGKCTSDPDCETGSHAGPQCNTATGACEPSTVADAGPDANDAAASPDADAGPGLDSSVPAAETPQNVLEGGGCGCVTPASAPSTSGTAALIALALGAALGARRSRRP